MNTQNLNSRSVRANDQSKDIGRGYKWFGTYMGFVKGTNDVQKNGRLAVWVPEFGSAPDDEAGWVIANYCSPFAGATNVETTSATNYEDFNQTQTSYGMWMVPPDINNQVIVMFINGDPARCIWIGCLYNQFINNSVPGTASSTDNYQHHGVEVPTAEYNKHNESVTEPDKTTKPYHETKFKGIGNQGLIKDKKRAVTNSSARRESPSEVFGFTTPGPVIEKGVDPSLYRRKGGSSLVMDDNESNEYIQLTTKSGAEIIINETNGFVYLINRDGTAWVQMDKEGNVDIFGAKNISMRAQRDINLRADRNINIEAGQNIFMKAAKDTVEETTSFTYDVNNSPDTKSIPVWNNVGEGNGEGGNIVMQSLNNWYNTSTASAYLTVKNDNLNVSIGNSLNLTTINGGQDYNSAMGVKITTSAALDIAATSNIRVGSAGLISVVGQDGVTICSSSDISLNATDNLISTSGGTASLDATEFNIGTNVYIDGTIDASAITVNDIESTNVITENIKSNTVAFNDEAIGGGLDSGPTPPVVPLTLNPNVAEGALSATNATGAEIKPLIEKINILATWSDPESKFKRNSSAILTTVSRLPTYEPCPEHNNFEIGATSGYTPVQTESMKTYAGSAGAGNTNGVIPAANTDAGANNSVLPASSLTDSAISKLVNIDALKCQLKIHEGVKNITYPDLVAKGGVCGGVGHLLRTDEMIKYPIGSAITDEQIDIWLNQDCLICIAGAQKLLGTDIWEQMSDIRKRACADLCYNMGTGKLATFVKFIAAMKKLDFNTAGQELKNSAWFSQVGIRGPKIVSMIVQNIDPNGCDKKFPG